MLIDTHCHLNFKDFDDDLVQVISSAKKSGVNKIIVPGMDIASSQKAISLSSLFPNVIYASAGYHPYEAQHDPDIKSLEKLLQQNILSHPPSLITRDRIVAIGECGLDYHLYKGHPAIGKKDNQKKLFENHCRLALKYNLPLIIHCRDAFDDLFDVIDGLTQVPRGVIHCFSGGLIHIKAAKQRGLYIGIDGNITFSKYLQSIMTNIPLFLLLLETDAPNLTPIPHRGSRNEPGYTRIVAKQVAQILNMDFEVISQQTTQNANKLFHLS